MRAVLIGLTVLIGLVAMALILQLVVTSSRAWRRRRMQARWARARREARWEDEVRTVFGVTRVFIRRVAKAGHRVEVLSNTETQVGDDVAEWDPDWDMKVRALREEARIRINHLNTET